MIIRHLLTGYILTMHIGVIKSKLLTGGGNPALQWNIAKYVKHIIVNHFTTKGPLLMLIPNDDFNIPQALHSVQTVSVIVSNSSLLNDDEKRNKYDKHKYYILLLNNSSVLETHLQNLSRSLHWNVTAIFLIVLTIESDHSGSTIFYDLWKHKIINVAIIISDGDSLNLYIWLPYSKLSECGKEKVPVLLNSWSINDDEHFIKTDNIFSRQVPNNFHTCAFKISCFVSGPYAIKPHYVFDSNNRSHLKYGDGVDVKVAETVSKLRNFTAIFLPEPPNNERWGVRISDKKWTGVVGNVYHDRADVAISALMFTNERMKYLASVRTYLTESAMWVLPLAGRVPQWKSLITVFPSVIWLLVFSAIIVSSCVLCFLANLQIGNSADPKAYKTFIPCLLAVWRIVLENSVSASPGSLRLRVFFIVFVFYSMQINTAYQAFLISVLSNPGLEYQMTSTEDVLKFKVPFGFHPNSDPFFQDNSTTSQIILQKRIVCYDVEQCITQITETQNFAIVHSRHNMKYVIAKKFLDSAGKPVVYQSDVNVQSFYLTAYMKRWCVLLKSFNEILPRIKESGFSDKWRTDVEHSAMKRGKGNSVDDNEPRTLTLLHLQSAFALYTLGISCSAVVFLLELYGWVKKTKAKI